MKEKNKILVLMIISMVLGYLPWYNFSAVSEYIIEEFNISTRDMGAILASFQLGYVIMVILTSWLADKIGKKMVIVWATLFTAIFSTMFVWLAKDFRSILILRLLAGLSAGAIYAPGMALLSDWFPPEERGKAIGAYTGALTASYAGGYFIASPLSAIYGWRIGILWTSLPVFIAVYIVFFYIKEKPLKITMSRKINNLKENNISIKPAPEGGFKGPFFVTFGYMGHMWELYTFWGWIGPFMVASSYAVGYNEVQAVILGGRLAAFIIIFGAPVVWLIGVASDKWGRSTTTIISAFASLIPEFFIGYLFGQSLALITIVAFWIGFWIIADSGIYKVALTEMVSTKIKTAALGVQSAAGYGMSIISLYLFGNLLEIMNPVSTNLLKTNNWGIPFLILGAGSLLAPISIIILKKLPQSKLMIEFRNSPKKKREEISTH